MTVHRLPGLHPGLLASYLAGLGVVRVLSEQFAPHLHAWWEHDVLVIDTAVADVADWLVREYRPSPIISPWNGGSGFGVKDKTPRVVLDRLSATSAERLHDFHSAVVLAADLARRAQGSAWSKPRLVAELRNRCPESLLGWLDASVVLSGDTAVFPPILGTGGNDGHLDFSSNYHQRLLEVIPELGANHVASRGWIEDLLQGTARTRLSRGAIGQFDPAAAGGRNSSPMGAADSLVNPWQFVLMLEGCFYFASGMARRLGTDQGRAAMPFCVFSSPDGPTPGAPNEQTRGELWTPVWSRPLAATEIAQLFGESRASWQGRTASQAAQMYAAIRSVGVARGVERFVRYGLHQRNGLAFSAVRLDDVDVREDAAIQLSVEPEETMRPYGRVTATAVTQAKRRFDRAHIAFARTVQPESLREMLAEQTLADVAVLRSNSARESLVRRRPYPRADRYATFLHEGLSRQEEFRVGAALASAGYPTGESRPSGSLRDIVVGRLPIRKNEDWHQPVVRGLGVRPLASVLADAVVWRARQVDDAAGADRGFVPFPSFGGMRLRAPWPDLHAWVQGLLDENEVTRSFLACLALDWRWARTPWPMGAGATSVVPIPELAVWQAFASGRVGATVAMTGPPESAILRGLQRDWPARILAGQRAAVNQEATDQLRRLGWQLAAPQVAPVPAEKMLAVLASRSDTVPLRSLGARGPSDLHTDPRSDHKALDQEVGAVHE